MLIVDKARVVVLEMPKTATQSLRKALAPYARELGGVERHAGVRVFERELYPKLVDDWNGIVECCCVVREPLARMQSWYRYRQRPKIANAAKSTKGITFDAYVEALLSDNPPLFVQTGRQSRFVGWDGVAAKVDHVFDYERLELLLEFLGDRLGSPLQLPRRNQSTAPVPEQLSAELLARFSAEYASDYALYRAVQKAEGHLRRDTVNEHAGSGYAARRERSR